MRSRRFYPAAIRCGEVTRPALAPALKRDSTMQRQVNRPERPAAALGTSRGDAAASPADAANRDANSGGCTASHEPICPDTLHDPSHKIGHERLSRAWLEPKKL